MWEWVRETTKPINAEHADMCYRTGTFSTRDEAINGLTAWLENEIVGFASLGMTAEWEKEIVGILRNNKHKEGASITFTREGSSLIYNIREC